MEKLKWMGIYSGIRTHTSKTMLILTHERNRQVYESERIKIRCERDEKIKALTAVYNDTLHQIRVDWSAKHLDTRLPREVVKDRQFTREQVECKRVVLNAQSLIESAKSELMTLRDSYAEEEIYWKAKIASTSAPQRYEFDRDTQLSMLNYDIKQCEARLADLNLARQQVPKQPNWFDIDASYRYPAYRDKNGLLTIKSLRAYPEVEKLVSELETQYEADVVASKTECSDRLNKNRKVYNANKQRISNLDKKCEH